MIKEHVLMAYRILIVLSGIFLSYFFLKFTITYTYPFLIALIVSLFINPVVTTMEKKLKFPRPILTLIVLMVLVFGLFGLFFLLTTEVLSGTLFLADQLPHYFQAFISLITDFINTKIIPIYEKVVSYFYSLPSNYQETINSQLHGLSNYLVEEITLFVQRFFIQIPALITIIPSSVTIMIFIALASFFITSDWHSLRKTFFYYLPSLESKFKHIIDNFKYIIFKYMKAQLILLFITICLTYSGLLILKVNHALTISFFIALVDLLPVIGTGFVFIPWILYLFLTGNFSLTIGLSLLYMITIIVRQLLEPRIITKSIGVNPLLGLVVLFVSLQAFGGTGLIIAPISLITLAVLQASGIFSQLSNYIKGEHL